MLLSKSEYSDGPLTLRMQQNGTSGKVGLQVELTVEYIPQAKRQRDSFTTRSAISKGKNLVNQSLLNDIIKIIFF